MLCVTGVTAVEKFQTSLEILYYKTLEKRITGASSFTELTYIAALPV